MISQRSNERINDPRVHKSIESTTAPETKANGGFLTKHEDNDRYHQDGDKKLERRESVLITSVLQRLSSMVDI